MNSQFKLSRLVSEKFLLVLVLFHVSMNLLPMQYNAGDRDLFMADGIFFWVSETTLQIVSWTGLASVFFCSGYFLFRKSEQLRSLEWLVLIIANLCAMSPRFMYVHAASLEMIPVLVMVGFALGERPIKKFKLAAYMLSIPYLMAGLSKLRWAGFANWTSGENFSNIILASNSVHQTTIAKWIDLSEFIQNVNGLKLVGAMMSSVLIFELIMPFYVVLPRWAKWIVFIYGLFFHFMIGIFIGIATAALVVPMYILLVNIFIKDESLFSVDKAQATVQN